MRLTEIAHAFWRKHIQPGQSVIDATAGNGHDTLILAECVGEGAKVFAFDIQDEAIQATVQRLEAAGMISRATLLCDTHANLKHYFPLHYPENIHATVFNLGYLPSGNHKITTKAETTLDALMQAWELIKPDGFLSVMTYPGHPEGLIEHESIAPFLLTLIKQYSGQHFAPKTLVRRSPELFLISKQ